MPVSDSSADSNVSAYGLTPAAVHHPLTRASAARRGRSLRLKAEGRWFDPAPDHLIRAAKTPEPIMAGAFLVLFDDNAGDNVPMDTV